jgi:hypothetical protein
MLESYENLDDYLRHAEKSRRLQSESRQPKKKNKIAIVSKTLKIKVNSLPNGKS